MMMDQPRGGHIFNIDGAGSDGRPTPRFTFADDLIIICIAIGLLTTTDLPSIVNDHLMN